MKDKVLIVKTEQTWLDKVDYLKQINGYRTRSETIRKLVYKEWFKEKYTVQSPLGEEKKKWSRDGIREPLDKKDLKAEESDQLLEDLEKQRKEIFDRLEEYDE